MTDALLTCTKCKTPLDSSFINQPAPQPCPSCRAALQVFAFPALYRPRTAATSGELVMQEGEANCFFHSQKRAVAPCDSCGRFLCSLCDVEIKGQHLCPDCLEKGVRKKKIRDLDNRRFLYDSLALQLAAGPVVFFPLIFFTLFTAPAALFVVLRYRKEPLGIMRRTRWRFLVAGVLATAQIAVWAFLLARGLASLTGL